MSDMWALALGIVVLAIWVASVYYYDSVHSAYTQGRIDQLRHKRHDLDYKGIARMAYKRGRRAQAMRHRLIVRSRLTGNGYGNISHK